MVCFQLYGKNDNCYNSKYKRHSKELSGKCVGVLWDWNLHLFRRGTHNEHLTCCFSVDWDRAPSLICGHIDTYLICECICAWITVAYSILSYRCHKSLKMHWCTSSQWWCGDYPGAHYAFFIFFMPLPIQRCFWIPHFMHCRCLSRWSVAHAVTVLLLHLEAFPLQTMINNRAKSVVAKRTGFTPADVQKKPPHMGKSAEIWRTNI